MHCVNFNMFMQSATCVNSFIFLLYQFNCVTCFYHWIVSLAWLRYILFLLGATIYMSLSADICENEMSFLDGGSLLFRDLLFAIKIWTCHAATSIIWAQTHVWETNHNRWITLQRRAIKCIYFLFHTICRFTAVFGTRFSYFLVLFSGNGCNMILSHITAVTFWALCYRLDISFRLIILKNCSYFFS